MSDRQTVRGQLAALVDSYPDPETLSEFLLDHSKLPGPRANLELAADLAKIAHDSGVRSPLLGVFEKWITSTLPEHAAAEYLPFCAVQGLGGLYLSASQNNQVKIVDLFRKAANSSNWRLREGTCLALQFIGEEDPDAMMAILRRWQRDANLLELRAIIVAIAHPPILKRRPDIAIEGIGIADDIFTTIHSSDEASRKQEPFRVVAKGMGFALSVIVVAAPKKGFAMMRRWAAVCDPDIDRMLKENLSKSRLTKPFPCEVEEIGNFLDRL